MTIRTTSPAEACRLTAVWPCQMPLRKYDFADPRSEQRSLAVHEAGHAVIARKTGLAIGRVSIVTATSDVQGDGDCDRRDHDGRREIVGAPAKLFTDGALNEFGRITFIVQAMAGFEAEALICLSPAVELWRSDIGDLADIARYNGMAGPFDLTALRRLARYVVSENRAAIEAVATELSRCGEISGSGLDAIMAAPIGEIQ